MQRSKIHLSKEESALVLDPHWILTKRSIMEKVGGLLGLLADEYRLQSGSSDQLPPEARAGNPKLSRGENYKGVPYMVLDYPSLWDREHVFAVRTMFWWGNYFSLCLHLKGRYREQFAPAVLAALERSSRQWFLAVGGNEWSHDITEDGYACTCELSQEQWAAAGTLNFFKAVFVVPLEKWDDADTLLAEGYGEIMKWIA